MDILDIWLFIAESDQPSTADRFLAKLYSEIEQIAVFPYANPTCPQIYQDVRRKIYGAYLIYYFVHSDRIEIARVLHGARNQFNVYPS